MKDEVLFEDIKVGDTVYLRSQVCHSWHVKPLFFLPHTVDRVTSAQFKVGNLRYRKSDGKAVGENHSAYKLGQKCGYHDKAVYDQTNEYEESMLLYEVNRNCRNIITQLDKWSVGSMHSLGIDKAKKIEELLEEICDIGRDCVN